MGLYQIFEYDAYANDKVWYALQSAGHMPGQQLLALFSHVIGAHHVWLCRIEHTNPTLAIWPELTLQEMDECLKQNQRQTAVLLEHDALDHVVHYKNSAGHSFDNNVEDILYHVANHSNYHRGQIATRMRDAGMEPVATDYIFFKRQQQ